MSSSYFFWFTPHGKNWKASFEEHRRLAALFDASEVWSDFDVWVGNGGPMCRCFRDFQGIAWVVYMALLCHGDRCIILVPDKWDSQLLWWSEIRRPHAELRSSGPLCQRSQKSQSARALSGTGLAKFDSAKDHIFQTMGNHGKPWNLCSWVWKTTCSSKVVADSKGHGQAAKNGEDFWGLSQKRSIFAMVIQTFWYLIIIESIVRWGYEDEAFCIDIMGM